MPFIIIIIIFLNITIIKNEYRTKVHKILKNKNTYSAIKQSLPQAAMASVCGQA